MPSGRQNSVLYGLTREQRAAVRVIFGDTCMPISAADLPSTHSDYPVTVKAGGVVLFRAHFQHREFDRASRQT